MRALVVFLFVLGAVAFMASCGSEVTEVAWKNVSATNLKVHEILWTQDNISWVDKTNGYAANTGVPTESKEVTSLSSNVECLVWDSVNEKFEAVSQVEVSGGKYSMGNSASLNEGESQVLNVNPQ